MTAVTIAVTREGAGRVDPWNQEYRRKRLLQERRET